MKSNHPAWQSLLAPYEAEQWDECAHIVRGWVDDDPFDLTPRALLASLHAKAGSPDLARLQYEKLLPMAVGQGDALWALCTQKRLDEPQDESNDHTARYRAMHEWFRYLMPEPGKSRRKARKGFSASALIGLPDDVFADSAARAVMHDLGVSRRTISVADGMLWLVYYGRVRWRAADARGDVVEHVAEAGHPIFVRAGEYAALDLIPEIPSECIAFEPTLAVPLGLAPSDTADEDSAPIAHVPDAPEDVPARPSMPTRDPLLEPAHAAGGSQERRRETRVSVALESKVAFLAEMETWVSPVHGKLADLSAGGLRVTFPAAQLRQASDVYVDAILPVKLHFRGSGEPINLAARVVWIRKGGPDDGAQARMGLEFVALSPENRSRLIYVIDEATRSGVTF